MACTPQELTGEVGRVQSGPWRVWLALAVEVGFGWWFRGERRAVCLELAVFGFWLEVVSIRARDERFSVFGLLMLYLWLWCCLPCVRCFALSCVALRSFCVFRSG